jgi:hypothetical protein
MIVGANIDAGASLAALLAARGHEVSVAVDGRSALDMALTRSIELFLVGNWAAWNGRSHRGPDGCAHPHTLARAF